jgi:hypothetical protein
LPGGERIEPSTILVEPDRLLIGADPQGIYEFPSRKSFRNEFYRFVIIDYSLIHFFGDPVEGGIGTMRVKSTEIPPAPAHFARQAVFSAR